MVVTSEVLGSWETGLATCRPKCLVHWTHAVVSVYHRYPPHR